jgi:hypothetical protein
MRLAAAVTESLPNLKKRNPPKALESCIHAASKANGRRKPCVVMIRTDSIHTVQLRSATEEKNDVSAIPTR